MGVAESKLQRWGVAIQALIAAVRRPAAQRNRNAAQAVIAAQLRWTTIARDGLLQPGQLLRAGKMYWLRLLRERGCMLSSSLMMPCARYFAHNILPVMFHPVRLPSSVYQVGQET